MRFILEILWRLWPRGRTTEEPEFAPASGGGTDQSSMAEFVRILRRHDEGEPTNYAR